MSSSSRTTSRGGKGPKADKLHKNDKSDTGKTGGGDKQQSSGGGDTNTNTATASTARTTASNKSEDPSMREKVRQVMEVSHKTEEEVCLALHECDNDIENAMNMLLDDEWNITVKKRRSKQTSSSAGGAGGKAGADGTAAADGSADDWNEQISAHHHGGDKEKPRNKSGGPPRLHGRHNDSRGWRGREKQENERNLEGGQRGDRRGRSSRGGPGRGRGGGRAGSRYPPRNNRNFNNSRPIDTWDNNPNTWESHPTGNTATENWEVEGGHIDEWSTEEYTGSLADTKVFTPSIATDAAADGDPLALAPDGRSPLPPDQQQPQMMQPPQQQQQQGVAQMRPPSPQVQLGALNAAQTQYLSQLTQQNSNEMKPTTYGGVAAAQQGSQYGGAGQYGVAPTHNSNAYVNAYSPVTYGAAPDGQPAQQPVRTKTQRARVPPPSKIPSSAVEMPDDLKTIGLLDVQFGALDLISDGMSFDSGVSESKFNSSATTTNLDSSPSSQPASNLDLSASNQSGASIDGYAQSVAQQQQQHQQKTSNAQSSISSALTQNLTNNDNIPQTSEHLTTGYSNATRTSMTGSTTSSGTPSTIELNKQPESHSYSSQTNTYNSYQANKSNYNQTQNYNTPSYSTTQTTTSYGSSQPNSYTTGNSGSSYNAAAAANNAYPNAYSTTSAYQSNAAVAGFPPSITQANSYPSNNQGYSQSASQSVYGANTGLNNSSNYGNATTTPQYSSYSATTNHKLSKENAYDSSATTASSSSTSTTSVSTASSALSLAQTTASGTKTTTTTLAKNSSGVVSNIPPGVAAPVMSTPYIMSQGIPYFQTPMYTYEDMQLLQQRIPPHMTTPFYEMSYQTPTTLTAVRDAPLSTYAMSDARFTRGDNNASPVPSTLSQQTSTLTQGHQGGQPILAAQAPQGFFYTPYSPMQSYQFGPVYGQIPTATNAHGSSNSTQYTKPSTYSSGYGSTFEVLGQSQDYTKGGYVGNAQGQSKGSGANPSSTGTSGNDLSAMYSKSHTAIGKVNSYDKQGFHSGTPPPFSGALHGSQNAGLTPSGSGYPQMYIPTMPPHQQHHSTQLMHQPLHQDSGNSGGQRSQASNQAKSGATKFQNAYWNQP